MKTMFKKFIPLLATLLLFACSDDFLKEDPNLNLAPAVTQEVAENTDGPTFVSSKQAIAIA